MKTRTVLRLCLTMFPLIVMGALVVLMLCSRVMHEVFDAHFWLFDGVIFVAALLQIGVAISMLRRDKPLAIECFVVAFIVIFLLGLSIPADAPPIPFLR